MALSKITKNLTWLLYHVNVTFYSHKKLETSSNIWNCWIFHQTLLNWYTFQLSLQKNSLLYWNINQKRFSVFIIKVLLLIFDGIIPPDMFLSKNVLWRWLILSLAQWSGPDIHSLQHITENHVYTPCAFMHWARFEPSISVFEWFNSVHVLDCCEETYYFVLRISRKGMP
jgi:hypothetical protein